MFEVGDYIIYGNSGVYVVDKIGTIDAPESARGRQYYTLLPYYATGGTIFTPVDNKKVIMRHVLGKEEAMSIINDIPNIDNLDISDERKRELEYKGAIRKSDCRELIKIIKTIYSRKQSRMADGKKVTAADEKYFSIAEDNLYGELGVSLGMSMEKTKDYVCLHAER